MRWLPCVVPCICVGAVWFPPCKGQSNLLWIEWHTQHYGAYAWVFVCCIQLMWTNSIRDHISPILTSLYWLPIILRVEFKILVLIYKTIHGQSPSYLEQFIVSQRPSRTLCSQDAGLLVFPRISKSWMWGRVFSYQAPLLWNYLRFLVWEADTLSDLASRLKNFLFDKAYS